MSSFFCTDDPVLAFFNGWDSAVSRLESLQGDRYSSDQPQKGERLSPRWCYPVTIII